MIGSGKIGLYLPGTHEIEDACGHPDHHPLINDILKTIQTMDFDHNFRAVQVTVDPKTEKAQVAFSMATPKEIPPFHPNVSSLWINCTPQKTNTIFSSDWRHLSGETHLFVTICERPFAFHPAAFIQANLEQFEKAVAHIQSNFPQGKTLVEYYAGIGVIGTLLASQCAEVTCVEINPFAELCFRKSAPPSNVSFVTAATEDANVPAEVTLLDPPRKGVSLRPLYTIDSPTIIYMSCNPKTFERDAEILKERGYALEKCATFDFFPGTGHLEVLGYFTR